MADNFYDLVKEAEKSIDTQFKSRQQTVTPGQEEQPKKQLSEQVKKPDLKHTNEESSNTPRFCSDCGTPLKQDTGSCPKCTSTFGMANSSKIDNRMMSCPVCKTWISRTAESCPKCGHLLATKKKPLGGCAIFAIVFFAIIAAIVVLAMGL